MGRDSCSSEYFAGYGCAVSFEIHSFLAKLIIPLTSCKHDSWLVLSTMLLAASSCGLALTANTYEVELQSSTISLASSGGQTSDFPSHGDLISFVSSFETLTTEFGLGAG